MSWSALFDFNSRCPVTDSLKADSSSATNALELYLGSPGNRGGLYAGLWSALWDRSDGEAVSEERRGEEAVEVAVEDWDS